MKKLLFVLLVLSASCVKISYNIYLPEGKEETPKFEWKLPQWNDPIPFIWDSSFKFKSDTGFIEHWNIPLYKYIDTVFIDTAETYKLFKNCVDSIEIIPGHKFVHDTAIPFIKPHIGYTPGFYKGKALFIGEPHSSIDENDTVFIKHLNIHSYKVVPLWKGVRDIAIGYGAGWAETGNDKFYLDNRVVYLFPRTIGANEQVLTVSATGKTLGWTDTAGSGYRSVIRGLIKTINMNIKQIELVFFIIMLLWFAWIIHKVFKDLTK
jgi:hypothetical protein